MESRVQKLYDQTKNPKYLFDLASHELAVGNRDRVMGYLEHLDHHQNLDYLRLYVEYFSTGTFADKMALLGDLHRMKPETRKSMNPAVLQTYLNFTTEQLSEFDAR